MEKKNKKAMRPCSKDSGVSPVVGVMLMLVVTIVVAAVVAALAGGLGASAEKAPASTLDVKLYPGAAAHSAEILNIAGDTLDTKDLLITVAYSIPLKYENKAVAHGGETITHIIDGSLDPYVAKNHLNTDPSIYPYKPQTNNNNDTVSNRVNSKKKFGEAELVSGSKIAFDIKYFAGFDTDAKPASYGFLPHWSVFHVTIVHKPSSTVLFDKDVRMG